MISMIWDFTFNVQCVEHLGILINVKDASFGFVEIIYSDIKDVRRVDNGTM